jgi:DNA-directed RNA polymerase subunit M/transcription elongation factor TFIIS
MGRIDEVATRCPHCGSLAAGRVSREEHLAGSAKLKCIYCGKSVSLPAPDPFPQSIIKETGKTFKLYKTALKNMGWLKVVSLLFIWVVGAFALMSYLNFPAWLGVLLPSLPLLYSFSQSFTPIMQAQVRQDLGVLRLPEAYRGMSERDPIVIHTQGEENLVISKRKCPKCEGKLIPQQVNLVIPRSGVESLRFKIFKRASRMLERVEVDCQKCDYHGAFYFDISHLEIVHRLGYTQELMDRYAPQKK